ncbi:MAG: hypothetical protein O7A63_00715 [Acidobacteria bacterium]|nr:hypothetical protein [Acidobacteriota bacterium]
MIPPRSTQRILRLACCGLALLLCAPGGARAAAVDFALGRYSYEGDFEGDDEITLSSIPLEMTIHRPGGRLTIILPYTRIKGTGRVTMTMDGPMVIGAGGPGAPSYQRSRAGGSESGLGDIILRDESYLKRGGKGNSPFVSWMFEWKIPTADHKKGLGTGERDWSLGLRYIQPLGNSFQLLGDFNFRFMGSRSGLDIDDRVRLMAGFAVVTPRARWQAEIENVTPGVRSLQVFDMNGMPTAAMIEADDYRVIRGTLLMRSSGGGTTGLIITKGLTDSAEEIGFAIRLSTGS